MNFLNVSACVEAPYLFTIVSDTGNICIIYMEKVVITKFQNFKHTFVTLLSN